MRFSTYNIRIRMVDPRRQATGNRCQTQVQSTPQLQLPISTLSVHELFNRQQQVDHDEAIEITDANMNGVSHLGGDHITLKLIDKEAHVGSLHSMEVPTTGPDNDKKLDVLASATAGAVKLVLGLENLSSRCRRSWSTIVKISCTSSCINCQSPPQVLDGLCRPTASTGSSVQ